MGNLIKSNPSNGFKLQCQVSIWMASHVPGMGEKLIIFVLEMNEKGGNSFYKVKDTYDS